MVLQLTSNGLHLQQQKFLQVKYAWLSFFAGSLRNFTLWSRQKYCVIIMIIKVIIVRKKVCNMNCIILHAHSVGSSSCPIQCAVLPISVEDFRQELQIMHI